MKVAIVGNSGSLLKHLHGDFINGHDMIYRFNTAPTRGYWDYVGNFTTLRFIAYHGEDYWLNLENILLYSYSKKAQEEGWDKLWFHNHVTPLDKKFIHRCDNMISKPYWKWRLIPGRIIIHKIMSSTGLKAIIYALDRGYDISLFGFMPDEKFHYFEDNREGYNPDKSHNYEKEKGIIKRYEDEGKLKVFS